MDYQWLSSNCHPVVHSTTDRLTPNDEAAIKVASRWDLAAPTDPRDHEDVAHLGGPPGINMSILATTSFQFTCCAIMMIITLLGHWVDSEASRVLHKARAYHISFTDLNHDKFIDVSPSTSSDAFIEHLDAVF